MYLTVWGFSASQPLRCYNNGSNYLIRRPFNPADTENAWLYDDTPIPCNHPGPIFHKCPVCHSFFLPSELFILHSVNQVPHRACPRCLNFLLSRQYNKCPICAQPHLYYRLTASALPRSITQAASSPTVPFSQPQPVRRPRQPSPPTSTIPLEE